MKISMFHLMPHRELPDDFEKRYKSVWVDPPFHELADASRVGQYYNWTLDELVHAARAGLDGICVNEHDHCYCFLSYFGNQLGKKVMDGFWEFVDKENHEPNPYRAGFLQLVAVGET